MSQGPYAPDRGSSTAAVGNSCPQRTRVGKSGLHFIPCSFLDFEFRAVIVPLTAPRMCVHLTELPQRVELRGWGSWCLLALARGMLGAGTHMPACPPERP